MSKIRLMALITLSLFFCSNQQEQDVLAAQIVYEDPTKPSSAVWEEVPVLYLERQGYEKPLRLRCAIFEDTIFFRVEFFTGTRHMFHHPWVLNQKSGRFEVSPKIEDSVCLRFEMPSTLPREVRKADVWYWGANRTAGIHADDLSQVFSRTEIFRSSPSGVLGARCFTRTLGDAGKRCWRLNLDHKIMHMNRSRYMPAPPSGSRADVLIETEFVDGWWSIVFSRRMNSGNLDDAFFKHDSSAKLDLVLNLEAPPGPLHPDPAGRDKQEMILLQIPSDESQEP